MSSNQQQATGQSGSTVHEVCLCQVSGFAGELGGANLEKVQQLMSVLAAKEQDLLASCNKSAAAAAAPPAQAAPSVPAGPEGEKQKAILRQIDVVRYTQSLYVLPCTTFFCVPHSIFRSLILSIFRLFVQFVLSMSVAVFICINVSILVFLLCPSLHTQMLHTPSEHMSGV